MKKTYSVIAIIFLLGICLVSVGMRPVSVLAQPTTTESPDATTTPAEGDAVTPTPDSEGNTPNIRVLRDRLASVVAELRKKDEQVIVGEVKSVDTANLEVDTISGVVEKIQLDETLSKYYQITGAAKEEIEQKDVEVGNYVIATGIRTEGAFSADEIYIDEPFDSKAGRVTEINGTNFTFRLETFDKDVLTVNVDRSVNQEILVVSTLGLEGSSFSRLREGDTVHIVYPVNSIKTQVTNVTPIRMLVIPLAYFN